MLSFCLQFTGWEQFTALSYQAHGDTVPMLLLLCCTVWHLSILLSAMLAYNHSAATWAHCTALSYRAHEDDHVVVLLAHGAEGVQGHM